MIGIYQIRNIQNNHLYIGSSRNIFNRWAGHRLALKKNIHHSQYLQRAWNKYGKENFEFTVLQEIQNLSELTMIEAQYIKDLKPSYNIYKETGNQSYLKSSLKAQIKRKDRLEILRKRLQIETITIVQETDKTQSSFNNIKNQKPIYRFTPDTIFEYQSIAQAAKILNISLPALAKRVRDGYALNEDLFLFKDENSRSGKNKAVKAFNNNEEFTFASLSEAASWLPNNTSIKVKVNQISLCCKQRRVSYLGYQWNFIDQKVSSVKNIIRKKKKKTRSVVGIHRLTGIIKPFESVIEAAHALSLNRVRISECCLGTRKALKDYFWEFTENFDLTNFDFMKYLEQKEFIFKKKKRSVKPELQVRHDAAGNSLFQQRKVLKIDPNTGIITEFNSIKEASLATNTSSSHISSCCAGKRNKSGGFFWEFFSETS